MRTSENATKVYTPTFHYPYWYGHPLRLPPWWLRSNARMVSWVDNWVIFLSTDTNNGRRTQRFPWQSGVFSASYPVLGPYYPLPSAQLDWQENWSTGSYYGYWWP